MPKDRTSSERSVGSRAAARDAYARTPRATSAPPPDDGPDAKKRRPDGTMLAMKHNEEDDPFIAIDKMRRITVCKFKGKVLVDFREFYTDKASGDTKPGKNGISLSAEQWAVLKANVEAVDKMVAEAEK
ncbi:hypothetical protein CspeluHIS016_0502590 [Cutaneotrichosporon spelunceum]|uniref:Transcriptional coactivator p15 (PC4) C-terminal domain-containing protein n=1 Tax=Cutaneotrichosporon spelunceum TaxID=1672016 RepID=A0AAD3TXH1_9TREE|nr:hypothetical protein CspeluHIS016_0502590 [Cutaneotrichosporon spelunceum]